MRRASGLLLPRLGFANENDQPYPCDECCIEEDPGVDCEELTCIDGDKPSQFQVVIAGITNDTCSDCDDLNDTYILDFKGLGFENTCGTDLGGDCLYEYVFPSTVCGIERIILGLGNVGTRWRIDVTLCTGTFDVGIAYWWREAPLLELDKLDCTTFDNYPINKGNASDVDFECNESSATASITSL